MPFKRLTIYVLYGCATLQFIRFYATDTTFYLNLAAYLSGRERLPFQERILPAILMRWFYESPLARYTAAHSRGAFTAERAPFFLLSLVAMVIAGIFVQRLYRAATRSGALSALPYPIFLFTMMWTYSIHTEADFSYPYDMLAVAFFSAGLYFIYRKQYVPLFLVVLLGTLNRETTLFLIGIYILDAIADALKGPVTRERALTVFRRVPWWRAALLAAVWITIKLVLAHMFAHNNNAENRVRLRDNFASLRPRLLPALLNICGYTLPVVLLFNRWIVDVRLRSYLWILPLWFGIMFYTGVLVETRIYGELNPYVAVALVLILERHIAMPHNRAPVDQLSLESVSAQAR